MEREGTTSVISGEMAQSSIRIVNARQHNLKGITVELPRRALVVITGPSGSGKSSLAFDTLYAEGQRRYIESLSTYAQQFLERMPKPLVDRLDGIAPAVAIEQRTPSVSSRSTVGTVTEVHDVLRLLWARIGKTFCRVCGAPVRRDTAQGAADAVVHQGPGRIQIGFPLPTHARSDHLVVVDNLRALGFVRLLVNGTDTHLDELPVGLSLATADEVIVIVDRLVAAPASLGRMAEAVALAFSEGDGVAVALTERDRLRFSESPACSSCETPALAPTPALFSFNNPRGACGGCNGFGAVLEYAESLIVPDPRRSISEGAIDPWTKPRYETRRRMLSEACRKLGIDTGKPWEKLKVSDRRELLHGSVGRYTGIFPFLKALEEKRYKQYIRVFLRQYQLAQTCPACHGTRLNEHALAVKINGASIAEVTALSVDELGAWLSNLALSEFEQQVGHLILEQATRRVEYLQNVGLRYLTFNRLTRTLSGGEAQRIALANAIGAQLVDSLYVLDEPSVGLHPRDVDRLLGLLEKLRDGGNSVIMVEHDLATIRRADFMLELGPGAGEKGGEVIYAGPVSGAADSLTGKYLTGLKRIGVPSVRRPIGPKIQIRGAALHNLRDIDVDIPLGCLTALTGVSGSGKSTLLHDVLYRQLETRLEGSHSAKTHLGEEIGKVRNLTGWEGLDAMLLIDQSPIGRTPRSNPITYIKGFDEIRELFAAQPLSLARGYTPATFSFNMAGGRCEACEGAGYVMVEMVFLADVFVPCEACNSTRFRREVLDVRIQGYSIHDVLQFTVDEAILRFRHQPKLGQALWHLQQVGLGYLRLGQPATTLSGGEAQRLKIARELAHAGKRGSRRLYLLDEPTTGLHLEDVRILIGVLDRLVDAGHTVVVIEHHLDVIKRCDWVIDLGPEGGSGGGTVVAMGSPEQVARTAGSFTGEFLREVLAEAAGE